MDTTTTKLVLDKLTELAQSLGTTADNIFNILIKQAAIEAQVNFLWIIILSILLILSLIIYLKLLSNTLNGKYGDDFKPVGTIITMFAIIIFLIVFAFLYELIYDYITTKYNPEYWALNKILEKMFNK